jgi:hypothetical protein
MRLAGRSWRADCPDAQPRCQRTGATSETNSDEPAPTKPAKKVLELSLREALAHKDNSIGCEQIGCEHILRGGDTFTLGLLTEHVDTAQLRAAVIGLLDAAA